MSHADPPRRFFEGEQPPPEPFAEHVLARWTIDVDLPAGDAALHTIWPDGCTSLFVVASKGAPVAATMIGPRLRALRVPVRGGLVLRGIRLWPDTAAHVLGVDPVAVRDLMRPAAEVLGVGALSLARALARAEASIGATHTNELAVMMDTFRPLRVAKQALPIEDPAYHRSWIDAQHAAFNPPTT